MSYLTAISAEERKTASCATDPVVKDTALHKAERSLCSTRRLYDTDSHQAFIPENGTREVYIRRSSQRMTVLGLATDRPDTQEIKTQRLPMLRMRYH